MDDTLIPGPVRGIELAGVVRAAAGLNASYVNLHASTFTRCKKHRQELYHVEPEHRKEDGLADLRYTRGIKLWLVGSCSTSKSEFCGEYVVSQVRDWQVRLH